MRLKKKKSNKNQWTCSQLVSLLLKIDNLFESDDGIYKFKCGDRLKGKSTWSSVQYMDKSQKKVIKLSTSNRKIEADIQALKEVFNNVCIYRLKPRLVKYLNIWIYGYVMNRV